jgi:hypothetical protein
MLLNLLTVAVLGLVGFRLAGAARRIAARSDLRRHILDIVRGVRLRHVAGAIPVFAVVIILASVLVSLPVLSFGWWTAIGGTGNPVTGGTTQTSGTPLEWIVPAVFLTMLIPALPLFAEREEVMFRRGAEGWSTARRIRRGVEFGLVHAIIGIPIGVALALSLGGWYFTWCYLRGWRRTGTQDGAVMESTRAHFAYNATILTLVLVAIALGV